MGEQTPRPETSPPQPGWPGVIAAPAPQRVRGHGGARAWGWTLVAMDEDQHTKKILRQEETSREESTARREAATDTTGVLRAASPEDVLAFVPHCLGFVPRRSLVLLTLAGHRLGATLRVDLPAGPADAGPGSGTRRGGEVMGGRAGERSSAAAYSDRICTLLSGDPEADGVLLVVYTDEPWPPGTPAPYAWLVGRLRTDLSRLGMELRDGWLSGNGHWRDYFCASADCCPWPGYPLEAVSGSRLNAELVFRGSAYAPSLQSAVGLPGVRGAAPASDGSLRSAAADPDPVTSRSLAANRRRYAGRWTLPEHFPGVLEAWDRCFQGTRSAEGDGLLLASLESKPVRDAVLVLAAMGLTTAVSGSRHWLDTGGDPGTGPEGGPRDLTAEAGQVFRGVLIGDGGQVPDWNSLDRAHDAFTSLLRIASGEPAAALLTLLGWLEWARGRSSRADVCLSEALAVCPEYRLARLLQALLLRGALPDWARSPETAWRPGAAG